jgi:hypothetical protein
MTCLAQTAHPSDTQALAASAGFKDAFGKMRHPLNLEGKTGSVLIFYWHDCPICNSYVPEINRLRSRHPRFAFYLVEVDPDWTSSQARDHVHQFNLEPPLLLDPHHRLVALAQATVTPEAVVFGAGDCVLYRGRIDNTYPALGVRRPTATTHDLNDALDAILAGQPVASQPPAVGCWISP